MKSSRCAQLCGTLLFSAWWAGVADAGPIVLPGIGTYVFVPAAPASGAVPNTLPFSDAFEGYPVNFPFGSPTNGWKKSAEDASCVVPVASLPVSPTGPALFSGNCLSLSTEGQTFFNSSTGTVRDVWVDLSLLMTPCEDFPAVSPETMQLGLALDADSRLAVYCGLTNGFLTSDVQLAAAGQTVRVTVQLAYAAALPAPFFRVFVDEGAVKWAAGAALPGTPAGAGGEWLPCAATNRNFCGLGFSGTGYVDALRVSSSYVGPDAPPQATIGQAVAVSWLADYGRRYQVETCEELTEGAWRPFGAPVVGDGTTNSVFDTMGAVARRFYRVLPLE